MKNNSANGYKLSELIRNRFSCKKTDTTVEKLSLGREQVYLVSKKHMRTNKHTFNRAPAQILCNSQKR
jgi:hypothetical protein